MDEKELEIRLKVALLEEQFTNLCLKYLHQKAKEVSIMSTVETFAELAPRLLQAWEEFGKIIGVHSGPFKIRRNYE